MTLLAKSAVILLLCSVSAFSADVSGTWNATARMPDGTQHESTLTLQEREGKLTGKISSKRGSAEIAEGTTASGRIAFTVVRVGNGDELKVRFSGTVQDDVMNLQMEYRDHGPVTMTARRVR